MEIMSSFIAPAISSLLFMIGVFLYSLLKKDNSIADIAWGIGFIITAITSLLFHPVYSPKQILTLSLIILWGTRLAIHITMRNRGRSEDFRYKQWRDQWGNKTLIKSFFQVYILQWLLMQCIATSIVIINTFGFPAIHMLDIVGCFIWGVGFIFETIGDYQLLLFKRNIENKGKIMDTGLWKYTRHPNYFGEVTQWWGIFVIALSSPYGFLALISPLVITTLILKVSGIPLLEKKYIGNALFEQYKQKTSVFFPWFPKQE
jgi:steroid 5-alpha reductase family enzyme